MRVQRPARLLVGVVPLDVLQASDGPTVAEAGLHSPDGRGRSHRRTSMPALSNAAAKTFGADHVVILAAVLVRERAPREPTAWACAAPATFATDAEPTSAALGAESP